jgi:Asp-tRNA(Asn)/Glu-tRNA(Gln) amidotransferase A subunit family amidase
LPVVNLPLLVGTDDLPIGVQLIGASGRDERLLRTACELVRMVAEEG